MVNNSQHPGNKQHFLIGFRLGTNKPSTVLSSSVCSVSPFTSVDDVRRGDIWRKKTNKVNIDFLHTDHRINKFISETLRLRLLPGLVGDGVDLDALPADTSLAEDKRKRICDWSEKRSKKCRVD